MGGRPRKDKYPVGHNVGDELLRSIETMSLMSQCEIGQPLKRGSGHKPLHNQKKERILECLEDGYSLTEICRVCKIENDTLVDELRTNPEFLEQFKACKYISPLHIKSFTAERQERYLCLRRKGYGHVNILSMMRMGNGHCYEDEIARNPEFKAAVAKIDADLCEIAESKLWDLVKKHDRQSIIFWLCNRSPQRWSKTSKLELQDGSRLSREEIVIRLEKVGIQVEETKLICDQTQQEAGS